MSSKPATHRPTLYFFMVVGILAAVVMLKVELPLLLGMDPDWERKIEAYRWLLHIHAFLGCVALFTAPILFFSNFRQNHLSLHRRLGRIYAFSIFVSAPIGMYIAVAHVNNNEKWAAAVQGLLWLSTTLAAVYTAMHKQLAMHQLWITRSYALTLTFVISRFLVDVLKIGISPAIGGNGGLIWISTGVVLIIADMLCMPARKTRQFGVV